jgi:hypothetical protein
MNGINPKTDWTPDDGVKAADFNHIGNQLWEQVYGCFDLQGTVRPSISPGDAEGVASSMWLQMPPHTKLILTHANYVYLNNPTSPSVPPYPNVSVSGGTIFIIPTNNNVWDIDTAPLLYLNDTPAAANICVVLGASITGVNAPYAMFARVVVVPDA